MKPSKVIVVQQYDQKTGLTKSTFLVDPEALQAADEWISRNKHRIPVPNEIGMVMPELIVYITNDGDLNAATTEVIDIYNEIDTKGTVAIPRQEIDALINILENWGREKLG